METMSTNIVFLKSFLLTFDVQMVLFAENTKKIKMVWDGLYIPPSRNGFDASVTKIFLL